MYVDLLTPCQCGFVRIGRGEVPLVLHDDDVSAFLPFCAGRNCKLRHRRGGINFLLNAG